VDSPYYSESELRGGAVTVVFEVLPVASDALLTTLHPLLEIATSFKRIVEQAVLTSELPFHGWKSPQIAWGEIWTVWRIF
jgi:hypothetical protein